MPSLNLRNPLRRDPNRPTLKQRAAALKATAARLIRKPKNGPNADAELCALAGPWEAACRLYDQRIEEQSAIERAAMLHPSYPGEQPAGAGPDWQEWRRRCDRWREQTGIAAGEEASGEACLALGEIEDQIASLPARTLAGLQIKARVAERNSSVDVEWPEGLGDGLVADLLSLTGSLPAATVAPSVGKPDPIFALIEASSTDEAVDWHSPPPGFMAHPAIEPASFLNIRYGIVAELERLRDIARAEYARREPHFRDSRFAEGELETRLSALRDELRMSALDAAIADPKALRAADADLIALGQRFDALHALWREADKAEEEPAARRDEALSAAQERGGPTTEEIRAAWALPGVTEANERTEKAYAALEPVVREIAAAPAHTIQGLAIKARVLVSALWPLCNYEQDAARSEGEDWGEQIARQLIEACCAASGVDWRGQPQEGAPALTDIRGADAELIALGHAFDAATVRDREANDALSAAEDRAEPHMPERPAALFLRVEDAPFCLRKLHCHPEALQGQPVTSNDIEWMTRCPAQHEVWIDAPPGSKGWNMMPGKVPQIVPWPEAQARIDEIFAAWTAWEEEKRRVMNEAGVFDARDTTDSTSDAAAALARQVAAQPAHTVEGMRAKLRVAAFYCVCDPGTSEGEGYPGEAAIRSLYRDTPGIEIGADPSDVRIVPEAPTTEGPALSLSDQIISCWRDWSLCSDGTEEEESAVSEALRERRYALIDAAEELPPTLANLPSKALALAWLDYVEHWRNGQARDAYSTDGRFVLDIDTAICGRLWTGA